MVIIIILKKLLLIMSIFLLQILFPEMLNVYFPLFRISIIIVLSCSQFFIVLYHPCATVTNTRRNGYLRLKEWLYMVQGMVVSGGENGEIKCRR